MPADPLVGQNYNNTMELRSIDTEPTGIEPPRTERDEVRVKFAMTVP